MAELAAHAPAVELEGLFKRYRSRRRGRRGAGVDAEGDPGIDVLDIDDDEDDDDEEETEAPAAPQPVPEGDTWALRDVSLTVARGASLGVIGANGAGKTTLLKILARIVLPTEGRAVIRGRLAPMLAVATTHLMGDFTTRQNVRLLCQLFGIPDEVGERRMDAILEFAELTALADVKVRTYATGFRHRLAFSCAINLEPDVLISDGVLAVGDKAFRIRCLDRVRDAVDDGLSLVLASHSMPLVRTMCDTAVWLEHGRVRELGPAGEVVDHYEQDAGAERSAARQRARGRDRSVDDEDLHIAEVRVIDGAGAPAASVWTDDEVTLALRLVARQPELGIHLTLAMQTEGRRRVRLIQAESEHLEHAGEYEVLVCMPSGTLESGSWRGRVNAIVTSGAVERRVVRREAFVIDAQSAEDEPAQRTRPTELRHLEWRFTRADARRVS